MSRLILWLTMIGVNWPLPLTAFNNMGLFRSRLRKDACPQLQVP
uniref:Uncharacterized protein n=1 Tax=Rhizophora mucronata TaxID=61149 RepID=A0A2P2QST2_RHIMU